MIVNVCQRCGSFDFIADRALAGRIICANCGTPASKSVLRNTSNFTISNRYKKIIISLVVILLIIILIS